jgi:hypothetical protein
VEVVSHERHVVVDYPQPSPAMQGDNEANAYAHRHLDRGWKVEPAKRLAIDQ